MIASANRRRRTAAITAIAATPIAILIALLGAGTASAQSQQDAIASAQQAYNDAVSKRNAAKQQADQDDARMRIDLVQMKDLQEQIDDWAAKASDLRKQADVLTAAFDASRGACAHGLNPFACVQHENQEAGVRQAQADALRAEQTAAYWRDVLGQKIAGFKADLEDAQAREVADQSTIESANNAVAQAKSHLGCVKDFGCWTRQTGKGATPSLPHSEPSHARIP